MLTRPECLELIADRYPDQPMLLTLGGTLREMISIAGQQSSHLPILDAMGQPAAIGLGLALGLSDHDSFERVIVIEGDGSQLMGFSSFATIGHLKPKKLLLIVFDNGVYHATGGQPTVSRGVDLSRVSLACGWPAAQDIQDDVVEFEKALEWADQQDGPVFLRVHVSTDSIETDFFLEDPVVLGRRFMDWLND